MRSYDDRELAREMQTLAAEIRVPAAPLRRPAARRRVLALAASLAVVALALVVGQTLLAWRAAAPTTAPTGQPTPSQGVATASPTAAPSPSSGALVPFPEVALLAGTTSGHIYRVESGRAVGDPVEACPNGGVLTIHPQPQGHLALVVCGDRSGTGGEVTLVDVASMTRLDASQPVLPRADVAAWSPNGKSVALLQEGTWDGQAPVSPVHLALWDIASDTTQVIRPDEVYMGNVLWSSLGLAVSFPSDARKGTVIWDGKTWSTYSTRALRVVSGSHALLVDANATLAFGGKVWLRSGTLEEQLTTGGWTEFPLGIDGDEAIVGREHEIAVYRGQTLERTIPLGNNSCLAAQQWRRWLICGGSGATQIAYSLDARAVAQETIAGLPPYRVIQAIAPVAP